MKARCHRHELDSGRVQPARAGRGSARETSLKTGSRRGTIARVSEMDAVIALCDRAMQLLLDWCCQLQPAVGCGGGGKRHFELGAGWTKVKLINAQSRSKNRLQLRETSIDNPLEAEQTERRSPAISSKGGPPHFGFRDARTACLLAQLVAMSRSIRCAQRGGLARPLPRACEAAEAVEGREVAIEMIAAKPSLCRN